MERVKVMLSRNFIKALDRLDTVNRGRVFTTLTQLQDDPDHRGLNLEPVHSTRDSRIHSVRVTKGYRIILAWLEEQKWMRLRTSTGHGFVFVHRDPPL